MAIEKIFIHTLGCPKNEVDSRAIAYFLKDSECVLTLDPREAKIIILNTCGFLKEAIQESLEYVSFWRKLGKKVVVTGCAVERLKKRFWIEHGAVAIRLDEMPNISLLLKGEKISPHPYPQRFLPLSCNQEFTQENEIFSYVKIQEGCIRRCSYCVIPQIRGRIRSRAPHDILQEITILESRGVREIVLIAQDLTLYGRDIGTDLNILLKMMEKLDVKLRLMYLHPGGITKELIKVISYSENILPYLHIPIQHISSRILKDMKRAGGKDQIMKVVSWVRNLLPTYFIRTDIMVGFPGESDEDFKELLDFIEDVKFERIAVFRYSKEEGALSAKLKDVDEDIIEERFEVASMVAEGVMEKVQEGLVGKEVEVIVHKDGTVRSVYDAPFIDFEIKTDHDLSPGFHRFKISGTDDSLNLVGFPL